VNDSHAAGHLHFPPWRSEDGLKNEKHEGMVSLIVGSTGLRENVMQNSRWDAIDEE